MYGTEQLAQAMIDAYNERQHIREHVDNSPEPLRAYVYATLGEDIASAIDGTDLYHEIIDHLENMY